MGFSLDSVTNNTTDAFDSVLGNIDKMWELLKWKEWVKGEHLWIPLAIIAVLAAIIYVCFRTRKHKGYFSDFISRNLVSIAVIVWLCGVVIYLFGYSDPKYGTTNSIVTLLIRSVLSSFEMFLSKSNLIGIANECKEAPFYMFCFALIHASAIAVSMIFVISCFGKRLRDYFRYLKWRWSPCKERDLYVFWGVNEKSILLANSVCREKGPRIVFVDFPSENEENKSGQSFSGILGLLRYNVSVAKQLSGIEYVMMKTDIALSGQEISSAAKTETMPGFLDNLHLFKLSNLVGKYSKTTFFMLGDDENANLHASLRLLGSDAKENLSKIYCCARRSRAALIHEECSGGKLYLVDDSHEAVMELGMNHKEVSQPINFVDVNAELGCVESKFTSLIVGFGYTGQDALKFLYEFSAFPDKDGNKTPVKFYVCDKKIPEIKGDIYQDIPQMPELENEGVIEFCPYNYGTESFLNKLKAIIGDLNYVVVSTGSDAQNVQIAVKIYEYAMQYRYRDGYFDKFKIFVRLRDSSSKYVLEQTIKRYDDSLAKALVMFGDPSDIYTKSWLIDDVEAKAVNDYDAAYNAAYKEYEVKSPASNKPRIKDRYQGLHLLKNRNSLRGDTQNRANVRHCYTKGVLLGLNKLDNQPLLPVWGFTPEDVADVKLKNWYQRLINVSICEHLRWNASHYMLGYTTWPDVEAGKYSDSCDWLTKRHKYIVDWAELDDPIRNYDYVVVVTTINMRYNKK